MIKNLSDEIFVELDKDGQEMLDWNEFKHFGSSYNENILEIKESIEKIENK